MNQAEEPRQPGIGRFVATNPTDSKTREFIFLKIAAGIGSDESNDFVIRDNSVSRRHAEVSFEEGQLKIRDLGSTNGTFVNGKRVEGFASFDKGDQIRIGAVDFVFFRNASPAAAPARQSLSATAAKHHSNVGHVKKKKVGDRTRLASLGDSASVVYWLTKRKVKIGSGAENDLALRDETVSAKHAIIRRRLGRFWLSDVGSTNGTFVNDRRLRKRRCLAKGDEVRFGSARFAFLQSPSTREIRRRVAPRTKLVLLFVAVMCGFASGELYLNRDLSEKLSSALHNESVTSAERATDRKQAKTDIAKAQGEAAEPAWLRRLNYYRKLAGLRSVRENHALSHADYLHARYLVKYKLRTHTDHFMHSEDAGDPYYTPEGLAAAQSSNVSVSEPVPESGESAIDGWIRAAFHRLSILDPGVQEAGFASYTESGLQASALYLPIPPRSASGGVVAPVEFPPANSSVPLAVYEGFEWPDPLSSCPGYEPPTGLAVTLQLGAWIPVTVTTHSFSHNSEALEHCVFDASNYSNPDPATEQWAKQGLKGSSAVILIPRSPLTSGERYNVSITANGRTYAWSFSVE